MEIVYIEALKMPNGEIISMGKTLGFRTDNLKVFVFAKCGHLVDVDNREECAKCERIKQ